MVGAARHPVNNFTASGDARHRHAWWSKKLRELLSKYIGVLDAHEQKEEADSIRRLLHHWQSAFVKAVPKKK